MPGKILHGEHSLYIGAHRGASAEYPDNTMSAFKRAVELKADMLELDVQLTKDGEVVVYHDFYLGKNENKIGLIKDYPFSEIKNFDVGHLLFSKQSGDSIPLLEEVLAWAQNKIWLSIELKSIEYLNEPLVEKVTQLVEAYQMEEQVQVMSSNHALLAKLREINRRVMTNVIAGSRMVDPIRYLQQIGAQVYNAPIIHLSPLLVDELHKAGLYVHGSVSDDIEVFRTLYEWNVDVMDTNIPDIMIQERELMM